MAKVKAPWLPCPKCGDTQWSGPRYKNEYVRGGGGWTERLEFTCDICGYVHGVPCNDAPRHD